MADSAVLKETRVKPGEGTPLARPSKPKGDPCNQVAGRALTATELAYASGITP